jgi:hypothetical protein
LALQIKDDSNAFKLSEAYLRYIPIKNVYEKNNLIFIADFLTRKSKYFHLFFYNRKKINEIVNVENFAENSIMSAVYKEEVAPVELKKSLNWEEIEAKAFLHFGDLGQERIWAHRMLFYHSKNDWINFGKYYKLYFDKVTPFNRSFIHMNNISWSVFEHVSDTLVIHSAINVMQKNINEQERYNPASIDTYACLLYKAGRKEEALKWEELATRLSSNSPEFVTTLEKMKAGEKIWK